MSLYSTRMIFIYMFSYFIIACIIITQPVFFDKFYEFIVTGIVTFVAAWAGGWAAFNSERTTRENKEKEEIKRRNIVNGNSSIFALMRMFNKLLLIQRQVINPVRGRPTCFLDMPALTIQEKDDIKLNVENLYFLLETDDRNLLGEIINEEERYKSAINALNERSRLHIHEVQPLLEKGEYQPGGFYTFSQIESMLGQRIYSTLNLSTEQVITHVDNAVVSIKKGCDALTASLKKQYPKEIIIHIEVPE